MLTRNQAGIIAHSLGDPWSTGKTGGRRYRNHYVGHEPDIDRLVELGWMKKVREGSPLSGGDLVYAVTHEGGLALDSYLASINPHERRGDQDFRGLCPYCKQHDIGIPCGCEWDPSTGKPATCASTHHLATPATLVVGTGRDNWRLCAECAALPRFKSKRKRVPIVRRDA